MDDNTDAFARLKRRHVQGELTDDAYEREKGALLGNASSRGTGTGSSAFVKWSLATSLVGALVIGAYMFGRTDPVAAGGAVPVASGPGTESDEIQQPVSEPAPNSLWAYEVKTDPMSDAEISQASATLEGTQFDVQVAMSCSNAGDIAFTATTFDKQGQPAEMRSKTNSPRFIGAPAGSQSSMRPMLAPGSITIDFQVRLDDASARSLIAFNPAYNNQITLQSKPVSFHMGRPNEDPAEDLASASRVTLRLFMPSGEETYQWPQNDADFRSIVEPCLVPRRAQRERMAAAEANKVVEDRRQKEAYVDSLYDDPSVDPQTLRWLAKNRNVAVDEVRLAKKRADDQPQPLALPN